jgi:CBS domain-containing protein
MAQTVRDVMTADPYLLEAGRSVADAARVMKDAGIGDVLIQQGDRLCGIVTDRDITVRAVAEGKDPRRTPLWDICSTNVVFVSPNDPIEEAAGLMRTKALRRLPVIEGGHPVRVVSLGDLGLAVATS